MKILHMYDFSVRTEIKDGETKEDAEDRILEALEPYEIASFKSEVEEYEEEISNG